MTIYNGNVVACFSCALFTAFAAPNPTRSPVSVCGVSVPPPGTLLYLRIHVNAVCVRVRLAFSVDDAVDLGDGHH